VNCHQVYFNQEEENAHVNIEKPKRESIENQDQKQEIPLKIDLIFKPIEKGKIIYKLIKNGNNN
jgi:hypothetical protein